MSPYICLGVTAPEAHPPLHHPSPCPTHVELHFRVTVAAFHELPKLGQHPQQLPLALVHEDTLVGLDLFRQAPQGYVDVLD